MDITGWSGPVTGKEQQPRSAVVSTVMSKSEAGICIPSGSHHATIRIAVESTPRLVQLGLEFAAAQLIAERIEIGDRLA